MQGTGGSTRGREAGASGVTRRGAAGAPRGRLRRGPPASHTLQMIDSGLAGSTAGRGTTRAKDAQGTPTQSHISPSILVYEDYHVEGIHIRHNSAPAGGYKFTTFQYHGRVLIDHKSLRSELFFYLLLLYHSQA